MKKLLYVGGSSVLLVIALICGALFAAPLLASAHSTSTTPTTVKTTTTALTTTITKDKHPERAPLREFVRNHSDELVDRIAPQLHLTASQVTDKLKSGERLVAIAKAQGISKESLSTILIQTTDASIAQALSNGKIDQTHATLLNQLVQAHPFVVSHVLHRHYTNK
jgi:hypothetical protein